MKILIVSHTPHYLSEGRIVGWGATVREIDELSRLFESVVHIAPLYPGLAPASAMPYRSKRVRVRTVHPAGGERFLEKLGIPFRYPGYLRTILQERNGMDVIHVRCPANISLLTLIILAVLRRREKRWVKYAGDWNRGKSEPLSYQFQRWLLSRNIHGGVVTVNGRPPKQAAHIHSFLNPCLLKEEIDEGREASRTKELCQPVRLIFVGRIESAKGVDICLKVLADLAKKSISAVMDFIGEGEETPKFQQQARELGVSSFARFHGGIPRDALGQFYAQANFILLPSDSEGWPKVLSEAMAYGVVPIASAVGCIPEYLDRFVTGRSVNVREARSFSDAIDFYMGAPRLWKQHSENAVTGGRQFSYDNYLQAVRALLRLPADSEPALS